MRVIRSLSAIALLAATAACSSPLEPTLAPSAPRYDGGLIYMGSGTSAAPSDSTESLAGSRGSGYMGTGL